MNPSSELYLLRPARASLMGTVPDDPTKDGFDHTSQVSDCPTLSIYATPLDTLDDTQGRRRTA
jgi:hypothetical protein